MTFAPSQLAPCSWDLFLFSEGGNRKAVGTPGELGG